MYVFLSQAESFRAFAREQLQMWAADAVVRQGGGPAGTARLQRGLKWCVCVCVYQGGSRLTLGGGGNMCRRFDL